MQGGYSVLPNPAMPNTFLAHAYDLSDPYGNISCYKLGCCRQAGWNPNSTLHKCLGCSLEFGGETIGGIPPFCDVKANFYMG